MVVDVQRASRQRAESCISSLSREVLNYTRKPEKGDEYLFSGTSTPQTPKQVFA